MFVVTGLIGLLMLVTGAELLVRGGGQLALIVRIPALVVGLTIVAFGTSTPELAVSITAAAGGNSDMALANVTGSNIANIALVLGLAAMVRPLRMDRSMITREVPALLVLQLLVPLFAYNGVISRIEGVILLAVGITYNVVLMYTMLKRRAQLGDEEASDDEEEIERTGGKWYWHVLLLLGGIVILVVGGVLFVEGAKSVAGALGLSDRYVGLSILALGTSAPEIATSMVSSFRGQNDLAVGNSVGSNILNISMVLAATAIVTPVNVADNTAGIDLAVAVAATILLGALIILGGRLGRIGGAVMATGYIIYLILSA